MKLFKKDIVVPKDHLNFFVELDRLMGKYKTELFLAQGNETGAIFPAFQFDSCPDHYAIDRTEDKVYIDVYKNDK